MGLEMLIYMFEEVCYGKIRYYVDICYTTEIYDFNTEYTKSHCMDEKNRI